MAAIPHEITNLLLKWGEGEERALDELISLVYPELRRIARLFMRRENPQHTLQTSALINEAYLRLVDQQAVAWNDRAHFFAVAAQVMRHILIDHARRHRYAKRGGGAQRVDLESVVVAAADERATEFVALDEALKRLAKIDPRKEKIVELRFFGGLTVEETAEVMKISEITVKRDWRSARAWLLREIGDGASGE